MEENTRLEADEKVAELISEDEGHKKKITIPIIVLAVIVAINLIFSLVLFSQNSTLQENISILEAEINDLDNEIVSISLMSEIRNDQLEGQRKVLGSLLLSQHLDGGIVTDQFVIEKTKFYDDVALVDISTQPIMTHQYLGYGNFSTNDRDLRRYLITLIDNLKTQYNNNKIDLMKSFEELEVYITIRNYDIATYENGALKLIGE